MKLSRCYECDGPADIGEIRLGKTYCRECAAKLLPANKGTCTFCLKIEPIHNLNVINGRFFCTRCASIGLGEKTARQPDADPVDHPDHYGGGDNPYEAIKVIEACTLGFCLDNEVARFI